MTTNISNKTSLKVPLQLPEFIRSETSYETFVAFIQAYYEWMEQSNIGNSKEGALSGSQNLLNYTNIDYKNPGDTYNKFIDYYMNEFLPNFPQDALSDKTKLIKVAKELYSKKGTPASYQFLFRALYNSDADIFLTKDLVLKTSDGKWYVSKSLRLKTNDEQFLSINNLRILGESSKSIATIERGTQVGDKIELYISNIERIFQSGEFIRVVDNKNQTLYFKDSQVVSKDVVGAIELRAKILGTISSLQIKNNKRGQLYRGRTSLYSGDPVVFYGGLETPISDIGAKAFIYETTSGSLRDLSLINGSYGYREDPNTYIQFRGGGGTGAIANVGSVDPATQINVAFIAQNYLSTSVQAMTIGGTYTALLGNITATSTASLANALTYTAFPTYALDSIILNNGGGGYTGLPAVTAKSLYDTTDPQTVENLKIKADLASLGILGPIEIVTPGTGYANGDNILFLNSHGNGANANVTVNATGSIISTQYRNVYNANGTLTYSKGGIGYTNQTLPTLNVATTSGNGAVLRVNTVLGDGAVFEPVADERGIGSITSFVIENYGEDYVSAPNVSLRVRDLVVTNVSTSDLIKTGETVYQGTSINTSVFHAFVDSITLLEQAALDVDSKYLLRTYNYSSNTKTDLKLNATDRSSGANLYLDLDTTYELLDNDGNYLFKNGIRTYGNGAAQATAKFLNGLIIGQGTYLNDDGFLSSFQVLESEDYNNFTYQLKVQNSFSAYKDILYKMLHPSGTKVVTINTLKSEKNIKIHRESFLSNSLSIGHYTSTEGSNATVFSSFNNPSNNIIKFDALVGTNLESYLFTGSKISLTPVNGPSLYSEVLSVSSASNTAIIKDRIYQSFANVANARTDSPNSKINIVTITNAYDLINNGEYSNTENKLEDIAFVGDKIRVYANATSDYTGTVTYISYSNNSIFVTPPPSFSSANCLISIGRNLVATGQGVQIYNTLGSIYYPELSTEDGNLLTTEDLSIIVLG
jgi:hypothetical protein